MYELFIEMLNQLYWDGYAETLAKENPEAFTQEYTDFFQTYQS